MRFDKDGRELPDPTPIEVPSNLRRPETLTEKIQRLIRSDVSKWAEENGEESFEEANDFEVEDDDALSFETHHELHEEVVGEVLRVKHEERDRIAAEEAASKASSEDDREDDSAPSSRNSRSRSSNSRARSPQRRPTGRREDAQSDDDEINRGTRRHHRERPDLDE